MRRAYRALFLVVFITGGLCGQATCFPLKATDDRKKEIELPTRPGRIISLVPTHTELLFALGLEKEIVGVSRYCDYPAAARKKEQVGGFIDVDMEKIVALRPDLILAFGTMQLPVVEALEKRGLRVFWIYPHNVQEVLESFTRVGRITGAVREAAELRTSVEKDLESLRKALGNIPDEKRPTVFRVMSFNTRATVGRDSFQTDLFYVAGGRNTFPAPGKDYFELDAEQLAKGDPTVVLVCGNDEQGLKQQMKDNPLYKDLPAVMKGSVLVLPCEFTCRPGPRIAETARKIARYLYPELNKRN